jgi:hypothetical protein
VAACLSKKLGERNAEGACNSVLDAAEVGAIDAGSTSPLAVAAAIGGLCLLAPEDLVGQRRLPEIARNQRFILPARLCEALIHVASPRRVRARKAG